MFEMPGRKKYRYACSDLRLYEYCNAWVTLSYITCFNIHGEV